MKKASFRFISILLSVIMIVTGANIFVFSSSGSYYISKVIDLHKPSCVSYVKPNTVPREFNKGVTYGYSSEVGSLEVTSIYEDVDHGTDPYISISTYAQLSVYNYCTIIYMFPQDIEPSNYQEIFLHIDGSWGTSPIYNSVSFNANGGKYEYFTVDLSRFSGSVIDAFRFDPWSSGSIGDSMYIDMIVFTDSVEGTNDIVSKRIGELGFYNEFNNNAFYDGHYYKAFDDLLSWNEAKDFCNHYGGHLVSINSYDENVFLTGFIRNSPQDYYIIGLSNYADGTYSTWEDGYPVSFTNWGRNQPDNSEGAQHTVRIMNVDTDIWNYGDWDDFGNYYTALPFICEWDNYSSYSAVTEKMSELDSSKYLNNNGNTNNVNATIYDAVSLSKIKDAKLTVGNSYLGMSKNGYYTVAIGSCGITDFSKLSLVPLSSQSGINAVHCNGVDALINPVEAVREKQEILNIKVYADGATEYRLITDSNAFAYSSDGVFSINSADVVRDKPIYVQAKLSNGNWGKMLKTNIKSVSNVKIDIKMGDVDIVDYRISDDVPFIGGKEIKLSLKDCPVGFKIDPRNHTIKVALGVETLIGEGGPETNWEKFGKAIKDLGGIIKNRGGINQGIWEYVEKKADSYLKKSKMRDFELDFTVAGYAEGGYDSDGITFLRGNLYAEVKGGFKHEFQAWAGWIPVLIKVGISADVATFLGIELDRSRSISIQIPNLKITFPKIKASGGMGIKYVGDVSVYGEASNVINIEPRFMTAALEGELGFSAKFLFFEGKVKLWDGSWTYYRKNYDVQQNHYLSSMMSEEEVEEYILDTDNYSINRPKNTSEWLGDTVSIGEPANFLSDGEGGSPGGQGHVVNTRTLQTDVYTGASPEIVRANGQTMMIWTASDGTRVLGNHTVAAYSLYDETTDTWSAPQAIDDDGTADFYPHAATDGEDIYVVWSNAKTALDDTYTMNTIGEKIEIAAAKYDFANGTFESEAVTDNATLDLIQDIYVDDGEANFVWINNSTNDPFLEDGTNTVMKGSFDGDTVTVASAATENRIIYSASCGDASGFAVTYSAKSADPEATECDIVLIGADGTNADLQGATGFSPKFMDGTLVWYSNGALVDQNGNTLIESDGYFSQKYDIVERENGKYAILTVASDPEAGEEDEPGTDIYAYFEEGSIFGGAVRVTETEGYTSSVSGIFDGSRLTAVYGRVDFSIEDGEDDFDEICDLCVSYVDSEHEISLEDVEFDDHETVPGEALPIELTVKNSGYYTEDEFEVSVYDGNGELYHSETVECEILPGDSGTITFDMPVSEYLVMAEHYTVTVAPADGAGDDPDDNSAEFTVGTSDISLSLEAVKTADAAGIIANVENLSNLGTNASLSIYRVIDEENQELLHEYSIGFIEPGEKYPFYIESEALAEMAEKGDLLYIEIVSENEETETGDNSGLAVYDYDNDIVLILGDVDGDGLITSKDARALKQYLAGLLEDGDIILINADVNGDGDVTSKDSRMLKALLVS